ncbi:MAG: hypothetical protein WC560_10070 [Syntrophales bacterium]
MIDKIEQVKEILKAETLGLYEEELDKVSRQIDALYTSPQPESEPVSVDMSLCCKAFASVEGDDREGTYNYVCSKCGKPCDIIDANAQLEYYHEHGMKEEAKVWLARGKQPETVVCPNCEANGIEGRWNK